MAIRVLGKGKPIIAMVHLTYEGSIDHVVRSGLSDVQKLDRGGVDALLFENWGGSYPDRIPDYMKAVMRESSKITNLTFGVNVLPIEYNMAFEIARVGKAKFVQMDTLVDRLEHEYNRHIALEVDPAEVEELRSRAKFRGISLFANIQSKHYVTVPRGKPIETSAREAIAHGADALVVTGAITGEEPPIEKILRVKKVAGDTPVLIGSGLDAENAVRLLPSADGAIVGTSLKVGGHTDNPVDIGRVRQLMEVVRTLRR